MNIRWLRTASQTRLDQIRHIAQDNPQAARRVDAEIMRHVRLLALNPEMGCIGLVQGTRELVIGRTPFILVYSIRPDPIDVLRILHGAQRWPPTPTE